MGLQSRRYCHGEATFKRWLCGLWAGLMCSTTQLLNQSHFDPVDVEKVMDLVFDDQEAPDILTLDDIDTEQERTSEASDSRPDAR